LLAFVKIRRNFYAPLERPLLGAIKYSTSSMKAITPPVFIYRSRCP
jgi:hypothetical protein